MRSHVREGEDVGVVEAVEQHDLDQDIFKLEVWRMVYESSGEGSIGRTGANVLFEVFVGIQDGGSGWRG